MNKCPKCDELISFVNYKYDCISEGDFDGEEWDEQNLESTGENLEFSCPECGKTLFNDEKDKEEAAINFLKEEICSQCHEKIQDCDCKNSLF